MKNPNVECPFIIIGPGGYARATQGGQTVFYVPNQTIYKLTLNGPKSNGTVFYKCGIAPDPAGNGLAATLPGNCFPIRLN